MSVQRQEEKPTPRVLNITFQLKGVEADRFEANHARLLPYIKSPATVARMWLMERMDQIEESAAPATEEDEPAAMAA